ncbi:MAG: hypothetical protein EOO29_08370 [Comamonadaceae bacterium]|nr:MAG: hypothetical protein EOO29_08370 [Comamonadaceae bacterium]
MAELGARMSAQEFEQWAVMYRMEGWLPQARALAHAQLLAASYQGPSTRRGRGAWVASDFLPPEPWAPPAPRKVMKGADVLAFTRSANKRHRR